MTTYADGRRDGLLIAVRIAEAELAKAKSNETEVGSARRETASRIATAIRKEIAAARI